MTQADYMNDLRTAHVVIVTNKDRCPACLVPYANQTDGCPNCRQEPTYDDPRNPDRLWDMRADR